MKNAASFAYSQIAHGALSQAAQRLITQLQSGMLYGTPLSSMATIELIRQSQLNPSDLEQILAVVTEGAIDEFSRGFQQEAMQYLAVAGHVRRELKRN